MLLCCPALTLAHTIVSSSDYNRLCYKNWNSKTIEKRINTDPIGKIKTKADTHIKIQSHKSRKLELSYSVYKLLNHYAKDEHWFLWLILMFECDITILFLFITTRISLYIFRCAYVRQHIGITLIKITLTMLNNYVYYSLKTFRKFSGNIIRNFNYFPNRKPYNN